MHKMRNTILWRILRRIYNIPRIRVIKKSVYFDRDYYLSHNRDVAESGMDPARHYFIFGWTEGRNPSARFDNDVYQFRNEIINICPLYHYERNKERNPSLIIGPVMPKVQPVPAPMETTTMPVATTDSPAPRQMFASEIINGRWWFCAPLPAKIVNRTKRRFNVVCNGFESNAIFGGKSTALILAILFANLYHYDLRIISQRPSRTVLPRVVKMFRLDMPENIEYVDCDDGLPIDISDKDDFLCTMWCVADSVLHTPEITGKIYYIMQEVETFFYDHGDEHLRCYNVLTDSRLIPIVNSRLLHDYLIANGYENVKKNGVFFEPVFPTYLFSPSENSFKKKEKYKLFFYGRPSHQRNIFYFGLDNLNEAFMRGVLNPDEWIVYIAGDTAVPDFAFDAPVEVRRLGVMSWEEYASFISEIDLCYSMIYTPHPSYPPLDTTASGGVCVTNRFANKQDLSRYSENIIMADLNKESMIDALYRGAVLAKDMNTRRKNFENNHVAGTWQQALSDSIEHMHRYQEDT